MKRTLLWLLLAIGLLQLQAKTRKTVFIIIDGITAENIERLRPRNIFDIAHTGHYARGYCGGKVGDYSETPTISAIGYMNILTGTWVNKHNVRGNEGLNPNYNYWNIFRIAKQQRRKVTTGLFSSWTDNRTVLLGAGLPAAGNLQLDYVYDGYDHDTDRFPRRKNDLHIYDIDSFVCLQAAECLRKDAPDLSWVYLWYPDDAYHLFGNCRYSDHYVLKEDEHIGRIWEAVKYREKNFDEEWLVMVVTDHGRNIKGYDHGGQSEKERTIWLSTNLKKVNRQFGSPYLSHVDINPTICRFMDFELPRDISFELDGTSFYGKRDIYDLQTYNYEDQVTLKWKSETTKGIADIYMSTANKFAEGGADNWVKVGSTPVKAGTYTVKLPHPLGDFYKFEVVAPNNRLSVWNPRNSKRPCKAEE